jgi:HSP20 family protein
MLTRLPNRVSALFADPIHSVIRDLDRTLARNGGYEAGVRKAAPMSVWSDGNAVYVEVDVPGIARDNLDVSLENGQLTIRGQRKASERNAENHHEERFFGEFERHVALSDAVDPDSIEAQLRDGVLQIKVSKKTAAQRQKVAIQYGGDEVPKIEPAS